MPAEPLILLHHPTFPDVDVEVAQSAVDMWTAAGWVLSDNPTGYIDHAVVTAAANPDGSWSLHATIGGTGVELERFRGLTPDGTLPTEAKADLDGRYTLKDETAAAVSNALAEGDTVRAAAAEAVGDAIVGRDVLEGGTFVDSSIAFAVVDEDGRRTWLEVAPDGGPTPRAAEKLAPAVTPAVSATIGLDTFTGDNVSFAVVDEDGRRTWLEATDAGGPTNYATEKLAAALALDGIGSNPDTSPTIVLEDGTAVRYTDPARPLFPATSIDFRGDSITESVTGIYPKRVAARLGVTTYNSGRSSNTSTDIAIRAGGIMPVVTVTGGTIPATATAVPVTITPAGSFRASGPTSPHKFPGTLAGVPGALQYDPTTGAWTFTRDTAGTAIPVPTPALFSSTEPRYPDAVTVIMLGRNNVGTAKGLANVPRDVEAILGTLTPYTRRYLVLSLFTTQAETSGTTGYQAVAELNTTLADKHGPKFYDLRRDFIDEGLTRAGITPTSADTTAINADTLPPSLMADNAHPNEAGYQVMGDLVAEHLAALSWGYTLQN